MREDPKVAIAVIILKKLSKKVARRSPGCCLVGGGVAAGVAILCVTEKCGVI